MATTTTTDPLAPLPPSLKALALAGQTSAAATALPDDQAAPLPVTGAVEDSLRPPLGQRVPPQYSQALAALQRAIY